MTIPLAVKLSPFFSSMANMALRLARGGADGLVLFNRFYQPDFDLDALEVGAPPGLVALRRAAPAAALGRPPLRARSTPTSAITTGVHTHIDVLKGLMAGANVTMMASELLRNGVWRISDILEDLRLDGRARVRLRRADAAAA